LDTTVYIGTLKYNKRSLIETSGNSAGHHKDYIHFLSEIKWWIKSGENTSEGYSWLQNKLKSKIKKSGNIWLYVWLGTCDITSKHKKYISLASEDDQSVSTANNNIQKINELVKQYPNCRVTFLEIPIFSIKEWNEHRKHNTPDQFKDQDLKLEEQVYNLNSKIRTTNVENNNHSPVFSTVLIKISKTRKGDQHNKFTKRRSVNFKLYLDGIHTGHPLSKVWLKKIVQQANKDCYQ
jgi:hypothetical protein